MKFSPRRSARSCSPTAYAAGPITCPSVRWFNPTGAGTWLLTELDPDHPDDYAFGLADLGMGFPELGDIGIREIAEFRGLMGLGIERDLYFRPKYAVSVYAEAARAAGRIVESGPELDAAAERSRPRTTAGG